MKLISAKLVDPILRFFVPELVHLDFFVRLDMHRLHIAQEIPFDSLPFGFLPFLVLCLKPLMSSLQILKLDGLFPFGPLP